VSPVVTVHRDLKRSSILWSLLCVTRDSEVVCPPYSGRNGYVEIGKELYDWLWVDY